MTHKHTLNSIAQTAIQTKRRRLYGTHRQMKYTDGIYTHMPAVGLQPGADTGHTHIQADREKVG